MAQEQPITNCHTHIFTAEHVPPLLGRGLIPLPFYYLFNIYWLIAVVRRVKDKKGLLRIIYFSVKRPVDRIVFWWQRHTEHNIIKKMLSWLFQVVVASACTLFMLSFLRRFFTDQKGKCPIHSDNFSNPMKEYWEGESWYSIIRSIIMNKKYPNVYADISFIIYDSNIISLLKSSLSVPQLQNRILYGTDFYVVRQKGNDKKFWLDIEAHLTPSQSLP